MSNWRQCTVGDLVKEKIIAPPMDGNHGDIHPKGNDFVEYGIPFVMASDINDSYINLEACKFISKKQADGLRKGFAIQGDVLLTHKATIGRTAIVPEIKSSYLMLTPQVTYYRVIDDKILDNRFLKYHFDSKPFQETLGLWAGAGSTRAYLGILGQHNLSLRMPDLQVQKGIADILSTLDAKIDLNNRINTELEAMAKTLYDYWFVQFDFPDANGKPYKTSGGITTYNPTLKGEIPDGWKYKNLGDIERNIVTGKTPPTDNSEFYNGNVPFITIGDIRGNMHILNTDMKLSDAGANFQKNKFIPKGSLCVTCIASPGLIGFTTENSQTNQQINSIVFQNEENKHYLYFALNDYFQFSKGAKTGNTFSNMNKGDFEAIKLLHPNKEILLSFDKQTKSIFEKTLTLAKQNQVLIQLRDWLLPMLMNGQVKVQ